MSETPKLYSVVVVDPSGVLFEGQATFLSAHGLSGYFEILADHAPFIATLKAGEVSVKEPSGQSQSWQVTGGVVEVFRNEATVVVNR